MSAVVRFDGVGKQYRRGRERANLKAILPGRWGAVNGGERHAALHEVSFALPAGESLGLVGPNGAGKSTALKLVAGVIAPTTGRVSVNGRSASLIELGAGFHPDMTGRENVSFSASVLGMGPRALRSRFEQIVAFADINAYLDTPVKRYSSGMMARLGFAVASHLDAEVVVLDEVLAVGDAAFQRKCHARIGELRQEGAALLYVTHALWTLPQLCDRALLLVGGSVVSEGSPVDVLRAYESYHVLGAAGPAVPGPAGAELRVFRSVQLSPATIEPWGSVTVALDLELPDPYPFGQVLLSISNETDSLIGAVASTPDDGRFDRSGTVSLSCRLDHLPLQPGPYTLAVAFCGDRRAPVLDDIRSFGFTVRGDEVNPTFGATKLAATWRAEDLASAPTPQPGSPAEGRGL
ncbi:MAG: ABC transporter ATP-binding protein [Actinomycetota bacterium]|nr:ABC transporter ATP-binding protein [Actinomycetota bacterium]